MDQGSNASGVSRRSAMKSVATVAAAGMIGLPGKSFAGPKVGSHDQELPSNWLWMRPNPSRSDDEWSRLFERLKSVGVDAVLPEVYNGNTAFFNHPNPLVETRAEVLERMIPLAHQAGVEVHAWMWTVPCNNLKIVQDRGDWYAVNGKGEPANTSPAYVDYYKFLCPRRPEVREFIEGNVSALGAISELDGVHLDYVRLPDVILAKGLWAKYDIVQDREYPEYDYCYCDYCRSEFKDQTGIDPLKDLDDPSASDQWRQFRYDSVSGMVKDRLAPKARELGKVISAAVFPNWQYVRQAWHTWGLDAYLPMLYHSFYQADVAWIGKQVQQARMRLESKSAIYAGLFLPSLDAKELAEAIKVAAQAGASGVSLFDEGALKPNHWDVLSQSL